MAPRPPLAARLRPTRLGEVVGQDHLLAADGALGPLVAAGGLPSLILWGPPGCGKTTIARLLAAEVDLVFIAFSAVLDGVADLRKAVAAAAERRLAGGGTLLFVDEIHRWSKAQQDALLPHVEDGTVVLVGATTENPSFTVIPALLSRCRVLRLKALGAAACDALVVRAAHHPEGLPGLDLDQDARAALVQLAAGDGRRLLSLVEESWRRVRVDGRAQITLADLATAAGEVRPAHDRAGEAHYDVASAFIKSMRASDVQAALFWLARQVEAGEDPRFLARRVVIFASEDVGLADPTAMPAAVAAFQAVERLGMPEAVYPLTQAVIHCATAPKSNSTKAYFAAAEAVKRCPGAAVPLFLRNAPTALMAAAGYKQGYIYDHDTEDHYAGQECLPDELLGSTFYQPGRFGFEKEIARRLAWWQARRRPRSGS